MTGDSHTVTAMQRLLLVRSAQVSLPTSPVLLRLLADGQEQQAAALLTTLLKAAAQFAAKFHAAQRAWQHTAGVDLCAVPLLDAMSGLQEWAVAHAAARCPTGAPAAE